MSAWLSANGVAYPLEGETFIGRGQDCAVRYDNNTVSRKHVRVFERNGRWIAEDLGSSSGIFIDRAKVQNEPLVDGDVVHLGQVTFTFHAARLTPADGFAPRRLQLLTGALLPLAVASPALTVDRDEAGLFWVSGQSALSVWVNGNRAMAPTLLSDGAWVVSALGDAFQVQLSNPPAGLDPELEQLISQAPNDDGRWKVCADQLLERGEPLGDEMLAGAPKNRREERRWAGPVAHLWAQGLLEARYAHGFARRVMVREPVGQVAVTPIAKRLELAMAWPRAKFLRELHFEVQQPAQLVPALEWLPSLPLPPSLERISCGAWQRGALNDGEVERVQQAAERLRRRYPHVFFDEHEVLGSS